jgi:D-galactarolactone cycloisomerase
MDKIKIIEVEPFILVDKLETPFYFSQFEYKERKICIVKITTNNGLIGWGEGYGPALLVKAGIEQLSNLVIGNNPLSHENIWQDMYRVSYDYARKGIYLSALSAIDIALWDLKGKILGQPISTLLGGRKREFVQVYATGLYFTHGPNLKERLVEEAVMFQNQGYSAIKMKVGLGIETDIDHITSVRKALKDDIGLMIDANHAYSEREARTLIEMLDGYRIVWFEEPIRNEDYEGYARLRKLSKIPIAGGECEYLKYGALEMLSKGCVDIFQPDTGACGGITEVKNIMAIAQAYNTNMAPHTWGTGIAIAANLHLVSNLDMVPQRLFPASPLLEFDRSPNGLRDNLLRNNFIAKDSQIEVPSLPGLGVEVDEEKLNFYKQN